MNPLQQLRDTFRLLVPLRTGEEDLPVATRATEYRLNCSGLQHEMPMSIDIREVTGREMLGIQIVFKNAPDFAVTAIQTDLYDALRKVSGSYEVAAEDRTFAIEAPTHAVGAEVISKALAAIKHELTAQARFGEEYWQALSGCEITPEPVGNLLPRMESPKPLCNEISFRELEIRRAEAASEGRAAEFERPIDVTEAGLRNAIENAIILGSVNEMAKQAYANLAGNVAGEGESPRMVKANSSQITGALGPVLFEKYKDAAKVNDLLQEIQTSLKPELKL